MILASLLPVALASGLGTPGAAVPLYALRAPCDDPRYPALAGAWLVGCGPSGQVDRALSLTTNTLIELPLPSTSPALGDGLIHVPGFPGGGTLRLTPTSVEILPDTVTLHEPLVAPPHLSDPWLVALSDAHVHIATLDSPSHRLYAATPQGWYPPAIAAEQVAWIDSGPRPEQGHEAVWSMPLDGSEAPRPLSPPAAAHARHVVGAGDWLAWVEDDALVLHHVPSGAQQRILTRTGFSAAPTLDAAGNACWEELSPQQDVDIRCTDAILSIQRPGHQRWPARWGPWLVYREGDPPWLMTAPAPEPVAEETP